MNNRKEILKTWDIKKLRNRKHGLLSFITFCTISSLIFCIMAFIVTAYLFIAVVGCWLCAFYYHNLLIETKSIIKEKEDEESKDK